MKEVFFIRKGLVRSYLDGSKGSEEITFQLYSETQVFANAHSILFNEPSKYFYQAIENTKVYHTDLTSFIELTSSGENSTGFDRTILGKRILKRAFERTESFVLLSPEQRYQKYLMDNPNLANRVPDKYIANILGITPVSLSRIRSRMSSKKN